MAVRSIQAIFEDGVLKPTEKLDLQEHERVRIVVTSEAEWQRQFAALLEQVYAKTDRFPSEEIEEDITAAAHEARQTTDDRLGRH
jgi:predicted DNA-binding antitoxin AbrB/MazE fold protein